MKRRDFLKKSLLGAAALTVVPRHVLGGPGHTAPSDQLTKGIIGVGGMGRGHYGYAGTRWWPSAMWTGTTSMPVCSWPVRKSPPITITAT